MTSIDDKIAALEAKLRQARALKQKNDARQRAIAAKRTRAQDTRRKILAGALLLAKMESDDAMRQAWLDTLDASLTRTDDRALFGLPPRGQAVGQ